MALALHPALALLGKLGIKPFNYKMEVEMVFQDGGVFPAAVLDIQESRAQHSRSDCYLKQGDRLFGFIQGNYLRISFLFFGPIRAHMAHMHPYRPVWASPGLV